MKSLIKWVLNHLPRTLLQRIAGWLMPLLGLLYRGNRFVCPLCGRRYRKMLPYGYVKQRENALCPHCLSLERHRLLWLFLERETTLFQYAPAPFFQDAMQFAHRLSIILDVFHQVVADDDFETFVLERNLLNIKM